MRLLRRISAVAAAATMIACGGAPTGDSGESATTPPLFEPPRPTVRVQFVDSATVFSREPALGDTLALRATYHDSVGRAIPGRPVTSWELERPSTYYALSADGVVIPLKAGDGASGTYLYAKIDGVRGPYALSYRVLGWLPDTSTNATTQSSDVGVRLASGFRDAVPPLARRKGLNSDRDAILRLRCRAAGGVELSVTLPELARNGDLSFEIGDAPSVTERWNATPDAYTHVRGSDASELLARLFAVRNFRLRYTTADGRSISGTYPGRGPAAAASRAMEQCK